MKRLLTLVAFFATLQASAQQVNPVPDYVFRNQMSVGRNAVTDTGAYFSIGPRYGAVKGFMPPIVSDTASVNANKRNGLLIFSVQKNKFLYWDSVRVQWSDMAGGSGSYILAGDTAAMLAPYLRKADTTAMLLPYIRHAGYGLTKSDQSFLVDTLNIATRAWRQKGIDSVSTLITARPSGTGTTNYVTKWTGTNTQSISQIFDEGTNVGINTTTPGSRLDVYSAGYNIIRSTGGNGGYFDSYNASGTRLASFGAETNGDTYAGARGNAPMMFLTNNTERVRIFANGRVGINTGATDAGFQFDVNGTARTGDLRINSSTGFNTLFTQGLGGGGLAMVSTTDPGSAGQRLYSLGFGSLNYPAQARIDALSTEAWSATNRGSSLRFNTTANGATGSSVRMYIENDGFVGVNTSAPLARLHVAGNMRSDNDAYFATSSGRVGIGTATPGYEVDALVNTNGFDGYNVYGQQGGVNEVIGYRSTQGNGIGLIMGTTGDGASSAMGGANQSVIYGVGSQNLIFGTNSTERMRIFNNGRVFIGASPTDAGYQLDVNGNTRVTGKIDVTANDYYGLSIGRTGTNVIASQIYSSNGILYYGVENSTGGGMVTGSTPYAAVIGSGANYPLQFATNNATRATINTNGELLINTLTDDGDFKLQVNGNALISGSIKTANGGSSTAVPWHLGSVVATSVQLDTANYVEVEINGTFYRLAIVTPL